MYHNVVKAMTIAFLLIAPGSAQAVVVPTGLNPGDTYHLAFLTDGTHDADSTFISVYNGFVQDEAELNPTLTGTDDGVQWFVIGSTFDDDARDNALVSAAVYLLDGTTKVADGFADMWDGDIDNPIDIDQFGTSVSNPDLVFTGSESDGTKYFPNPSTQRFLGSDGLVQLGDPATTDSEWIFDPGTSTTTDTRSFYALSELLTVVPEPSSGMIACSLLALLWWRRPGRPSASMVLG